MSTRRVLTTLACALTAVLATAGPALPVPRTARPAAPAVGTTVRTHDGPVRGVAHDGYRTFDGIPYAAPPVGPLRWTPPRPAKPWTETRDATRPASACPQPAGEVPGGSTDEDCLYLNVTTPATDPRHPRPVIVWLHGGGFTTGAGSSYDAHRMATRGDAVVVTVNYRLGALGFLAHAGLPGSGTFGLADQQAALRWVRAGIGAFGGDPHNVTLAGESAGGYSVCAQLASPAAAGLFDRAIIQSGPCPGRPDRPFAPSATSLSTARETGARFAAEAGCSAARDVLACLRGTKVSRLLAVQDTDQQPAYDTPLLPLDPGAALAAGRFRHIPVLIGGNHDEGNGWAAGIIQAGNPVTPETWPDVVAAFFPDPAHTRAIVHAYPVTSSNGGPVFGAVIGDANFACPTLRTGDLLTGQVPLWRYEFADEHAPPLTPGTPPFPLGAPHAAELPYLFDLGGRPRTMTEAQHRLADTMIDYWTGFARTGDPNRISGISGTGGVSGTGAPRWPRRTVQSLAPDRIGPTRTAAARHHCGFWNTLP
ncbi:carboxylesterase family protein [Streptomyces sp. SID13726]|uniref:carboxylesterase/lipase family protein n=1 Tax=Streptomyces sp. SID13726 TaxID=2706058 RepID=UPI0013B8A760|nr:carboxylesterase family protein [Streptomyces sp. SID13726]NEB00473.1 carboxylesterase family protein [Streptomyces sp. SID13726]